MFFSKSNLPHQNHSLKTWNSNNFQCAGKLVWRMTKFLFNEWLWLLKVVSIWSSSWNFILIVVIEQLISIFIFIFQLWLSHKSSDIDICCQQLRELYIILTRWKLLFFISLKWFIIYFEWNESKIIHCFELTRFDLCAKDRNNKEWLFIQLLSYVDESQGGG